VIIHRLPAPRAPERVVLFGASGFIGRAIQARLRAEGIPALAITSGEIDLSSAASVTQISGLLKPADAVVMLSAITPDKGRDIATLMKNLAMMEHLCAALEKTGCAHLVYFSSDAVYDNTVARVTEAAPASPQDLYGTMHRTREIMAGGIKAPLLMLRPTLVYGADDTHNAYGPNRFRRMAQKDGRITLFGSGEELRDHVHVDDVAALAVHCLLRQSAGVLSIATGISTSFRNVAELVARQFGKPVEIVETPRANPVTHRHYDVTSLIKAFPDYRFISLQDGVARCHRETTGAA
jgi:nucleoside-diphosphate-sugar epimerase